MADVEQTTMEADSSVADHEAVTTNGDEAVTTNGDETPATVQELAADKSETPAEELPAVTESPAAGKKRRTTPAKKPSTPGSRVSRRQSNQQSGEKLSEEIIDELPKKARESSVDA